MKSKEIITKDGVSLYSGEAILTLKHGNRTYKTIKKHNKGSAAFFSFILRCVVGGSLPEKRPGLLWLYSGETGSAETLLSFPVLYEGTSSVTTGSSEEGEYATVSYNFLIPDTFLQEQFTISGLRINALDSDGFNDKIYAEVDFGQTIQIESKTNLYITWKLTIGNK